MHCILHVPETLTDFSGYSSTVDRCVSRITTVVTTGLCDPWQPDCWDTATQRRRVCRFTPTPFSLAGAQAIITTQAVIKPVYIIHQESDLPKKGLSTTNKVVIGVVVPVVIILAIVIGGVIILRRAKERERSRPQPMQLLNVQVPDTGQGMDNIKHHEEPQTTGRKWHLV
jgi:hypothetical protein